MASELVLVAWRYTKGQFLIALINGVVAGAAFWLIDIPGAVWLGLAVMLGSLIPYLGAVLGFVPAVVTAAVARQAAAPVLAVVGVWLGVQLLEALVLQPKIFGSQLRLHPLVVLAACLVGGVLLGPLGVIVAVPVTAAGAVVWRRLKR